MSGPGYPCPRCGGPMLPGTEDSSPVIGWRHVSETDAQRCYLHPLDADREQEAFRAYVFLLISGADRDSLFAVMTQARGDNGLTAAHREALEVVYLCKLRLLLIDVVMGIDPDAPP